MINTNDTAVDQQVIDILNNRYGARLDNGARLCPEILTVNWGVDSLKKFSRSIAELRGMCLETPVEESVNVEFGDGVFLDFTVLFSEFNVGLCDDETGKLDHSFHVSETKTHVAISMLHQIPVGAAFEVGLAEETLQKRWGIGRPSFYEYFGYHSGHRCPSGTITLGDEYWSKCRSEMYILDPDTGELCPQPGRMRLTSIQRRPSMRAGVKYFLSHEFGIGHHEKTEWCHVGRVRLVLVPDLPIPDASPLSSNV